MVGGRVVERMTRREIVELVGLRLLPAPDAVGTPLLSYAMDEETDHIPVWFSS